MDHDEDEMPRYVVKLALDGTNYRKWAFGLKIYLRALGLWEYVTGKNVCPPALVAPPPQLPADAKEITDSAGKASMDYQHARDAYNHWIALDARTRLVLIDTVDDTLGLSLCQTTESAQEMWARLQKRHEPIIESLRYTSLMKLQVLRQNDDESIDAFFDRFWDLWCNIEFSIPHQDACKSCTCCKKLKEHKEKRCLYEFLIRVRPEFAPSRDIVLLRKPQPTVFEALNDLRVVEIRLQLRSTSMSKKPSTTDIQCSHCGNFGPTYQKCTMRKNRRGGHSRRGSSKPFEGSSSSRS